MVFASSCSVSNQLGSGLVVPARAECSRPEHLLEEAEHLWAAERDTDKLGGICADWGKVMVKASPTLNPKDQTLRSWQTSVQSLGSAYTELPTADGESSVLDCSTGMALFNWPIDADTGAILMGFDLLLMTATKPTLVGGRYPSPAQIAEAWRADSEGHVVYFHNNRYYGITTFEDTLIQDLLNNGPPDTAL